MAGHPVIDRYLARLAGRLPADTVDELADGLNETFDRHLTAGLDPVKAAREAVAEFGEPALVVAAFVRQAPGRRAARGLLAAGPVVGGCWAATLIHAHAWKWPVPVTVRLAFGVTLVAVVAVLFVAATGLDSYRRTRWAATAGLGMIGLDLAALATVAAVAPPFAWPLAVAASASVTRITVTARLVPRILRR